MGACVVRDAECECSWGWEVDPERVDQQELEALRRIAASADGYRREANSLRDRLDALKGVAELAPTLALCALGVHLTDERREVIALEWQGIKQRYLAAASSAELHQEGVSAPEPAEMALAEAEGPYLSALAVEVRQYLPPTAGPDGIIRDWQGYPVQRRGRRHGQQALPPKE